MLRNTRARSSIETVRAGGRESVRGKTHFPILRLPDFPDFLISRLIGVLLADEAVRLPGDRRHGSVADARAKGIEVPDLLYNQLVEMAS